MTPARMGRSHRPCEFPSKHQEKFWGGFKQIWPDSGVWMVSTALWRVDRKAGRGKAMGFLSVSIRGDDGVDTEVATVSWREVE